MPRGKPVREHIRELMSDGAWWTPMELQRALEDRDVFTTAHMEKMRQLRLTKYGKHRIECKPKPDRKPGSQAHVYRLLPQEEPATAAPRPSQGSEDLEKLSCLEGEDELSPVAIRRAPNRALTPFAEILRRLDG